MGAYIVKVTNGSDIGSIENNIDVGFRYTDKLNSLNEAEIKLSGTGSVKRGLLAMGAEVEIYRNTVLEFKGLIDNFDTLDAGGMCIHVSGKEIRLAQEKGTYTNSPWKATASATINSAIIGESNHFTAGIIETGVDIDFRLEKAQSIWNGLGNLAKKTGQDINVNYELDQVDILANRGVSSIVAAFNDGLDIRNLRVSNSYPKGNWVKVYGKGDGANQIESDDAQGQDAGSQATYGVIKEVIIDRSIISTSEANARANIEVAKIKDPTKVYDFECTNPSSGGNELMESYVAATDTGYNLYGAIYRGQSFTVGNTGIDRDFYLEKVSFVAHKVGSPGTITVEIYAVDGSGLPTGNAISSGTYDGNSLTGSYAWIDIEMSKVLLESSTQYAVIMEVKSGDVSNYVHLGGDNDSPSYSGGNFIGSNDSGGSWWNDATHDIPFKVYSFASFNIKTGDHISLNSQDKDLTNEEVRIVGMERGLRGGKEYLSLQVTNVAFSELMKTGNELLGQLQKNNIDTDTYMQGSGNTMIWGAGINAKTDYPLKVGFYIPAAFITDEAGNLTIKSMTVDYDIDKFKQGYGSASFSGSDPQVQNTSGDEDATVSGTSGKTTPNATAGVNVFTAPTIDSAEAVWSSVWVYSNLYGGPSLNTTRISIVLKNVGFGAYVDPDSEDAGGNSHGYSTSSYWLATDTVANWTDGVSDADCASGIIRFRDDNDVSGVMTSGQQLNVYTHTHYSHDHGDGSYKAADHDHPDGSYDINSADIDHIAIADGAGEAGSVNASSVNLYLDFWNTATSNWDNKHSVLTTGKTLDTDVDITDSGTYPDAAGFWRIRVEPITATADFAQGILKIKHSLDN